MWRCPIDDAGVFDGQISCEGTGERKVYSSIFAVLVIAIAGDELPLVGSWGEELGDGDACVGGHGGGGKWWATLIKEERVVEIFTFGVVERDVGIGEAGERVFQSGGDDDLLAGGCDVDRGFVGGDGIQDRSGGVDGAGILDDQSAGKGARERLVEAAVVTVAVVAVAGFQPP